MNIAVQYPPDTGTYPRVPMMDVTAPEYLQVVISRDGNVVWINGMDGVCIFRACRVAELAVEDGRT